MTPPHPMHADTNERGLADLAAARQAFETEAQAYAQQLAEQLRTATVQRRESAIFGVLVFRIASFQLSLRSSNVQRVEPVPRFASVPHRRNTALLGLAVSSGEILPVCSLARILGAADTTGGAESRLLVLREPNGDRWGVPVDAVVRLTEAAAVPRAAATDPNAANLGETWSSEHARLRDGTLVPLLNADALFTRMRRALE